MNTPIKKMNLFILIDGYDYMTTATKQLTGIHTPRLWTPSKRRLDRRTSRGYEFLDWVAAHTSWVPLPWQRWLAIHVLEVNGDGSWVYREILILISRQNGKSEFMALLAAWWGSDGVPTIVGTSARVETARDSWQTCVDITEEAPDVFGRVRPRYSNGDWRLTMPKTKSVYKVVSASRRGARGETVHRAIEDEIREMYDYHGHAAISGATTAVKDAQIFMISNMGDDRSIVLNEYRKTALSNTVPDLGIFEWSGIEGCRLDDRDAWRQANPALGHTITESTLVHAMNTLPPSVFRTEHLCQYVSALDEAIDQGQWANCLDKGTLTGYDRNKMAAFLEVSQDLKHATLCVAAKLPNGKIRVEVAKDWTDLSELRHELPGWVKRINPRHLGYFPQGPSAAIAVDLKGTRNLREMKAGDINAACMGLSEQVNARQVVHSGQEGLTQQLLQSKRKQSGDGWRFERPGYDGVHVDSAYAAAGAVLLCRSMKDRDTFRFITADIDDDIEGA